MKGPKVVTESAKRLEKVPKVLKREHQVNRRAVAHVVEMGAQRWYPLNNKKRERMSE